MTPNCDKLFEFASRRVTAEDIESFCPMDPGYYDYVREFKAILASGTLPTEARFDVTETIGLTRWADAAGEIDPARFRRFRTFTNSVGLAMSAGDEGPMDRMPPNYLAISLLDDAIALQDPELLSLLSPAFAELIGRIFETESSEDEAPFVLVAQLVLAFLGFSPAIDANALSEQLLTDRYETRSSTEFFWGNTHFDQLHDRWKHCVELSFPRESTAKPIVLLRKALLPV